VRDKTDVTEMGLKSPYPVTGEVLGTGVTCAVLQFSKLVVVYAETRRS